MKVLVTAGPTREFIDPVRFITNRSTGKMGYAVAESAESRGHEVRLVSGPVDLVPPKGISVFNAVSAEDMRKLVHDNIDWCDALIMTAAVADWTPRKVSESKIRKGAPELVLNLIPTTDILSSLIEKKGRRCFIGFAANSEDLLAVAKRKMSEKHLDAIVANDISRADAGFGADTNEVTIIEDSGKCRNLPLMSKRALAEEIVQLAERRLA